MIVKKSTTVCELVEKDHQILKINPNEYQIHWTCKWQVAHGYCQAVRISNNDSTRAILELYPIMNTIELHMEKYIISH